jgi:aminopeptidase-like protein
VLIGEIRILDLAAARQTDILNTLRANFMQDAVDSGVTTETSGAQMHALVSSLYPICRSITGEGVRQTLKVIGQHIPLQTFEVASGTEVCDWTVPREWNIRDAYIKDRSGRRIVDFHACNLHVLNYSTPIHRTMPLAELRQHLFTVPGHPSWIPYRTSYYKDAWGFCLSEAQLAAMTDDQYEVLIDSTLADGSLSYAECVLPGDGGNDDEVLISCHVCHPSLANDNLSGLSVAVFLAKRLLARQRRYTYRFLFIPVTIGAITWLARNREQTPRIRHGIVLTCLGDAGAFHYKNSRRGAEIDRVARLVLHSSGLAHEIRAFMPYGYDERQYCSPGFDLPVGCLSRSVWGEFPEYHTSADNLEFVTAASLEESLTVVSSIVDVLEANRHYVNTSPFGEPALGRRGLYRSGGRSAADENLARLWVLNQSDGRHSLLDIAERAGMPFELIERSARELKDAGLLVDAGA